MAKLSLVLMGILSFLFPCIFTQEWKDSVLWNRPMPENERKMANKELRYKTGISREKDVSEKEEKYYTLCYASQLDLELPKSYNSWKEVKKDIYDVRDIMSKKLETKIPSKSVMTLLPAFKNNASINPKLFQRISNLSNGEYRSCVYISNTISRSWMPNFIED